MSSIAPVQKPAAPEPSLSHASPRAEAHEPLYALVSQWNLEHQSGEQVTVYALSEGEAGISLLENGRAVAHWAADDPKAERHLRLLLGRAEAERGAGNDA